MIDPLAPSPAEGAARPAELERLRLMLRRLASEPPRRLGRRPADFALESVETPYGPALRRVEAVPLPPPLAAGFVPSGVDGDGTVFLDTETTGLAGGTGTYVFLVGLASWQGDALRVTQFFLGDLAAEAAFLAGVRDALAGARRLVTFNGRTFDLPLLETRYLLARAPWWGADLAHEDLYPVARALWGPRLGDCRLATLEEAVLALDRGDDLAAAMMPQLYFRYLRFADTRSLPRIFAHNRSDLVALAALAARAERLLAGPGPGHDPLEWLGAARWYERRDPVRSGLFYEALLGASVATAVRSRAAWRLGRLWRRAGRTAETLGLWQVAAAQDPAPPLPLLVDLAKLLEHHAHDFAGALRATRAALARADVEVPRAVRLLVAEALAHRARRLERRAARAGAT